MARPLRLEFPGALYHVTSRGDGREAIYFSDADREEWLSVLAEVCQRFNWICHAYCLMDNHYHVLIETPDANLSQGMRQLNGVYTQRFNRLHKRVGHVFQGRYKAILVDKSCYLLELSRYIVLNPVRAKMVRSANDWRWSSYRATAGIILPYPWLQVDSLLSQFGRQRHKARLSYQEFVSQGKGQPSPWERLAHQIYLGDKDFVDKMQTNIDPDKSLVDIPVNQHRPMCKPLSYYEAKTKNQASALYQAYLSGGYTMRELADYFGMHYSTVSRKIRLMNIESDATRKT